MSVHKNVGRLQISVDHSSRVRVFNGIAYFGNKFHARSDAQLSVSHVPRNGLAAHQFHGKERARGAMRGTRVIALRGHAGFVDLRNAWMLQAPVQFSLSLKTAHRAGTTKCTNHLESHRAAR